VPLGPPPGGVGVTPVTTDAAHAIRAGVRTVHVSVPAGVTTVV